MSPQTDIQMSPTFRILLVEDSMRMNGVGSRCEVLHVHHNVITHFGTDHGTKETQPVWLRDLGSVRITCVLFIHCFFVHTTNSIRTFIQEYGGMALKKKKITITNLLEIRSICLIVSVFWISQLDKNNGYKIA